MVSNEMRTEETGGTRVLEPDPGAAHPAASSQSQKGIFDQLAEYLLQQPVPGAEAPTPDARVAEASARPESGQAPAQAPVPQIEPVPLQEPLAPKVGETGMRSQELVFRETAEQLIVEKEAFVREEVVLSRLVKEQVQDIHDRVKRTEVEVERISPQEAQQIVERPLPEAKPMPSLGEARPVPSLEQARPAPSAGEARPVARTSSPAVRTSRNSKTWWAWFALMVIAAVLIAFALGQFLGSSSPA